MSPSEPTLFPSGVRVDIGPDVVGDVPRGLRCSESETIFHSHICKLRVQSDLIAVETTDEYAGQIPLWINGFCTGHAWHHRGHCVLHGNTMRREGRAVTFVGVSGSGKSTTAAASALRDWSIVADDLTILGEDAQVMRGPNRMKLTEDACRLLSLPWNSLGEVNPRTGKRGWSAPLAEPGLVPLSVVCILSRTPGAQITRHAPLDAIARLLEHHYCAPGATDTVASTLFQRVAQVVRQTSVYTLGVPQGALGITQALDLLERTLDESGD